MPVWEKTSLRMSMMGGVEKIEGLVCDGLGLVWRSPDRWAVIHLGSGHSLCLIRGNEAAVMKLGSELLALGSWEWEGFDGYKNREPEIMQRFDTWLRRWIPLGVVYQARAGASEEGAREVAMQNAGET